MRPLAPARARLSLAGIALAAIALAAGATTSGAQPRDSAGVRIVENPRPLWFAGRGWTVAATPLLDIGTAADDPRYGFNQVMGLARLSDGRVVVGDMGASELRFFDVRGRFVGKAGRAGQGPGELRQLMGLWVLPGDTIVVRDQRDELEVFTATGAFVRGTRLRIAAGDHVVSPVAMFGDGTILAFPWGSPWRGRMGTWVDTSAAFRLNRDGTMRDTLGRFPQNVVHATLAGRGHAQVFGARLAAQAAGRTLYVGFGDRFEIRAHDVDAGRLTTIIRRAWTAPRVTAAMERAFREQYVGGPGEGGRPGNERLRALRERNLTEMAFASHLPAFSRLMLADRAGNLWVRAFYPWDDVPHGTFTTVMDAPTSWSVFDARGRWLGEVQTPARFLVREIGADYVLGVWRDDDDVEHVRMYALRK